MADQPERRLDLSVVSGTYNRLEHLKRMVSSVRKSVRDLSYEIVLVDGGSTDGTIEWCKTQNDIRLIEQGELLGAIKAFNAGGFAARGEYVAFLNDDIIVVGKALYKAYQYLQHNPGVGQVAFENDVRGTADRFRARYGRAFGFLYGQCCMTPKWLGDYVGWWGDEGMKTYGGDARLSLRLWELGFPTVPVEGCAIKDYVVDDELRKVNAEGYRGPGNGHPDTDRFREVWENRLPHPDRWQRAPAHSAYEKMLRRTCRTMRFKGMMSPDHEPRTALLDELKKLGPAVQVNQTAMYRKARQNIGAFQRLAVKAVLDYKPDFLLLQAQRRNNFLPSTVIELRRKLPDMLVVNWDGDTHYPMQQFHADIAKAVHLQLTVSPTLFDWYFDHGVRQIGYWPIGIEKAYLKERKRARSGADVLFMGALYGEEIFPEAKTRRDAVLALHKSEYSLDLYGNGWQHVGLKTKRTNEQHELNAQLHTEAKMALSVSQTAELWGYTSDRLYNITATGCPALVQEFNGMQEHGYVDGETCIAWSTIGEMLDKVGYYLKHEDAREEIGRRGREMTLQRHTWEKRMSGLLDMIRWMPWE